jgi:CO dehydrogenase maturation factor
VSVCGKGGSGKSTLVSLLAYAAHTRGLTTLVVDSDESNSGLFRMLGFQNSPVPLMELVGGKQRVKEKMKQSAVLSEAEIYLNDIPYPYIKRRDGLMLVSIGKILQSLEGCACPMGALSKEFLNKLRLKKHEITLVDMEAGVEHFGRGIEAGLDAMVVVVEPSFDSFTLAEKAKELVKEFEISLWAVLNKIDSEDLATRLKSELNKIGLDSIDAIPNDPAIFEACLNGLPMHPGVSSQHINNILDFLCLHHKQKEKRCA